MGDGAGMVDGLVAEAVGATDEEVAATDGTAVDATGVTAGPAVHAEKTAMATIETTALRFILVPIHRPPKPHLEADPIARSIVRCRMTDGLIAHL